jgi:uracil-DNA glycosylase family 4
VNEDDEAAAPDTKRRLEQLAMPWVGCVDCALCHSRSRVVFYRGNASATIAIVGDAPGREEDVRGLPSIGPAGKLLDEILLEAKVSFDDVCYLNMVGCRPPSDRAPKHEELVACEPRTLAMLRVINPAVVIMLGIAAAKLASVTSIGPWRGMPIRINLGFEGTCRGIVTHHPAFVLRHPDMPNLRRQMLSDIKVARSLASTAQRSERDL